MHGAAGVAGKAGGAIGNYAPLLVVAALVVGAIIVYSQSSGATTQGYTIIPGTDNSAARAADTAANQAAQSAQQQTVLTGFQALVGEATQQYNDDTQVTLGEQSLAGQVAQYQAQQAIANLAAQASEQQSNDALAAEQAQAHAQQQQSVWGALGGLFGGVESLFSGGLLGGKSSSSSYTGPNFANASFGSYG